MIVWDITRDKKLIETHDTYNAAFGALLKLQGQSVDHATRYEGWAIVARDEKEVNTHD